MAEQLSLIHDPATHRLCSDCRRLLPLDAFYRVRKAKTQWTTCAECFRAYQNAWLKSDAGKRYLAGREAYKREHRQRLKRLVMNAYGGKCACCGEAELSFLCMDHVNEDGAEHRRALRAAGRGGDSIYYWLRDSGFPDGFQVLCANCNLSKHIHGACAHQERRSQTA